MTIDNTHLKTRHIHYGSDHVVVGVGLLFSLGCLCALPLNVRTLLCIMGNPSSVYRRIIRLVGAWCTPRELWAYNILVARVAVLRGWFSCGELRLGCNSEKGKLTQSGKRSSGVT